MVEAIAWKETKMDERALKREVEGALTRALHLGRQPDIDAEVSGSRVLLKGRVENLSQKRMAIKAVLLLPDVSDVREELRLSTPHPWSDEQITRHILDGFTQDPNIHETALQVVTRASVATLLGTVDNLEEKRLAGLIAWWVPGVERVENMIAVSPHQEGTEGDLVDSIRQAFYKDVLINADTIGVAVKGDIVTLVGSVATAQERQIAEQDAYAIWGVREVINNLAIVAPE